MIEWNPVRLKWCGGKTMSEVNEPISIWTTGQKRSSASSRAVPFMANSVQRESFMTRSSVLRCPEVDVEQETADGGQDDAECRSHREGEERVDLALNLDREPVAVRADEDQGDRVGPDRSRDAEQE